jgi:hypothetical protein
MGWFDDWWESMRGSQSNEENSRMLTGFFIICCVIGGVLTGGTFEPSGVQSLCCGLLLLAWAVGSFALLDWGEGLHGAFDRKCRMIKREGNVCGKKFTQYNPNMYGDRGSYVGFYCPDCRAERTEENPFKTVVDHESFDNNKVWNEHTTFGLTMLFLFVILLVLIVVLIQFIFNLFVDFKIEI